jgi:O-antigen ligase
MMLASHRQVTAARSRPGDGQPIASRDGGGVAAQPPRMLGDAGVVQERGLDDGGGVLPPGAATERTRSVSVARGLPEEGLVGSSASRTLHILLVLVVAVPPLVVAWRREAGDVALALYRQPKLAAFELLAWAFLLAFVYRAFRPPRIGEPWPILSRPPILLLSGFLAWITATGLWGVVAENFAYELRQYALAFLLLATLLWWSRSDRGVVRTVCAGLTASMGVITLVGLAQMIRPIPLLPPVQPTMGVEFPSLMGYKNPAALAVVGQLFVLAGMAVGSGNRWRRVPLVVLLLAELGYLARLQSRTAYLALAAGVVWWLLLLMFDRRARRRAALLGALGAAVLLLVLATDRDVRTRVASALSIASSPSAYLTTDRGVYLRNSIEMARVHPFGVGLGDWQTAYPVFRRHDRDRSFDETFQVRRAHSDYAQILGETGWLGLLLWCLFLAAAVWSSARRAVRRNDPRALAHSAQLVALCAAMATDYLLDLPFHRQLFFLIVFLALAGSQAVAERGGRAGSGSGRLVLAAVALVAGLHSVYSVASAWRSSEAALMTRSYLQALEAHDLAARDEQLDRAVEHGRRFLALPGHDKTRFRDYLVAAHSQLLRGDAESAHRSARRALALHPYHPPTFLLMAALESEPSRSSAWRRGHRHIVDEAVDGFRIPYPAAPAPRGTLGP